MAAKPKQPSALHLRMIEVLKAHPEGITELEMAKALGESQSQFGRRRRYLSDFYVIEKLRRGKDTLYVYKGERETPRTNSGISQKVRAQVLHDAHGRCGMCGRTIEKHGITFAKGVLGAASACLLACVCGEPRRLEKTHSGFAIPELEIPR